MRTRILLALGLACFLVWILPPSSLAQGVLPGFLSSLTLTADGVAVDLSPPLGSAVFDPSGHAGFAAEVGSEAESIRVAPGFPPAGLTVSVNGVRIDSQTPWLNVSLSPGATTTIQVIAARSTGETRVYDISVTRVALSGLAVTWNGTSLSVALSPGVLTYAVSVGSELELIGVTPEAQATVLSLAVNGTSVTPSQPTVAVALDLGQTSQIEIAVQGPAGRTVTYTLLVTRLSLETVCGETTVALGSDGQYELTESDLAVLMGAFPIQGVTDWTATPASFGCSALGDQTVTLSGTGHLGEVVTCHAVVHVVDREAPVVHECPEAITHIVYGRNTETLPNLGWLVDVSDNCGTVITQNPPEGAVIGEGETTVTWSFRDPSGNEAPPCTTTLTINELPVWSQAGRDPGRTRASPAYGIDRPWFVPVYAQVQARQQSGKKLELSTEFVLIGKSGTIFLKARERDANLNLVGDYLLALDAKSGSILWTYPVLFGAEVEPAIGEDGTVYLIDSRGWLIALSPSAGSPRKIWEADLFSLSREPYGATVQPIWKMAPGASIPFWQPVLLGPEGNIYAYCEGFMLAFGPGPARRLLWSRAIEGWAGATAGPGGVLYTRKWQGNSLSIMAISADGTENWKAAIPARLPSNRYADPCGSVVSPDGRLFSVFQDEEGSPSLVILDSATGERLGEAAFGSVGEDPAFVALGPHGTLFVVTEAGTDTDAGAIRLYSYSIAAEGDAAQALVASSLDLGVGWADSLLVDARDAAHILVRRPLEQTRAWVDNGELFTVSSGSVERVIPVLGQVSLPPGTPGNDLAMGADGELYRLSEQARTTDPGWRGTALLKTVRADDPLVWALPSTLQGSGPGAEFRIGFRIDDPLLQFRDYTLTWDFGDGSTTTESLSGDAHPAETSLELWKYHRYASLGTYVTRLSVTVLPSGAPAIEAEVDICARSPSILQAIAWPLPVAYVGQTVTFGCDADVPCSSQSGYRWSFGDGGSAGGASAQHQYARPGTYDVSVEVGDRPLLDRETLHIEVRRTPEALIRATPLLYGEDGLHYTFTCELTDSAAPVFPVSWHFGDGQQASGTTGEEMHHAYALSGDETCSVTAEVDLGGGTKKTGEVQVRVGLPPFAVKVTPASGYQPVHVTAECVCLLPGWPTTGLHYEWALGDWNVGSDSPIHYWDLFDAGFHAISCGVVTPGSAAILSTSASAVVHVKSLPEPNGTTIPFLIAPEGVPCAGKCRWACGGDCPSTCESHEDVRVCLRDAEDGKYYLFVYNGVLKCGTHAACRWHDDCFDRCGRAWGECDWYAPCHMGCNEIVAANYWPWEWYSWQDGGGPYDGYFLYSNPPTWEGPFDSPQQ